MTLPSFLYALLRVAMLRRRWCLLGLLLGTFAVLSMQAAPPTGHVDSLLACLRRPGQPDTARVQAYWLLARALRNVQLDSARAYAKRGAALALRLHDGPGLARNQNGLAVVEYLSGNYPAAQRAYEAALAAAGRGRLDALVGNSYIGLGLVADAMGNVPAAVAYFERARTVYAGCRPPNVRYELVVLTNIGNTYLQAGQLAKAAPALRQALALVKPTTAPEPLLNLLDLIGLLQLAQHHPDSAAATWRHELRLARSTHQRRSETYALGNLAAVGVQLHQPAAALVYAQQAVALARQTGNLSQLADYTLVQARALHALGRAEAFDTLQRFLMLHDTLVGQARNQDIVRQQVRFDVANQHARIRVLSQQRRISHLRAEQQTARARQYAIVAGGLLALLLGGGGLMALLLRSRRRLQASEISLRQANHTQQELMHIIGHDLRGPVAMFQQVPPLLRDAVGPAASGDATALIQELDASAQQLGALVDNLLNWARMQGGLVSCVPVRVRAAAAVHGVVQLYEPVARRKGVEVVAEVAPSLLVWADLNLLATVLRNLLANAIKYTPAGGSVRVMAEATAGRVTFGVTDTGGGMAVAALAAVFRAEHLVSQPGTAGEPGTGLGLPLCRHFVQLLGAELCGRANNPGPGMRFWFVLPALSESGPFTLLS